MSRRWQRPGLVAGWMLLWMTAVSFWLEPAQRIEVRIERSSDQANSGVQLFVDDGRGFREDLSARVLFPAGRTPSTRTLTLELERPPVAIRIDPLDRPGRVEIHSLRVAWNDQELELREDLGSRLRLSGDIQAIPAELGAGIHLLSTGDDPQLILDLSPLGEARRSQIPAPEPSAFWLWVSGGLLLALALDPRSRLGRLAPIGAPLGGILALHVRALESWWIRDDPCLLASIEAHGIAAHFWNPEVWRSLSGNVLMPWQLFSLGTDAWLFGLEPRFFYLHQVAALCVLLLVFDRLLDLCGLEPLARTLATTLLVLSPAAFAISQQLMNRHYLEGAVLAVLAFGLYLVAVDRNHLGIATLGAGAYLAATTAKEVFVPLVVVLPLVPRGTGRARWRNVVPYLVVGGLYASWRYLMLGGANVLSGYAERGGDSTASPLAHIPLWLGLGDGWMLALLVAAAVACGVYLWTRSRWRLWGLAALGVVVVPLLPVASELASRHFFLPALLGSAAFATVLTGACRETRWLRVALTLVLLLVSLRALVSSKIWLEHPRTLEHYRAEGEFLWASDEAGFLLTTLPDSGYARCLVQLREERRGEGPGFCGDPCWCRSTFPAEPQWSFAGGRIEALESGHTGDCSVEAPLSVTLRYHPDQHRMSWAFGPWAATDGTFEVLLISSVQRPEVSIPVPIVPRGSAPYALDGPSRWLVKYRSNEGWQTYSPVLTLDPAQTSEVFYEWSRPADLPTEAVGSSREFGVVP